MVLLYEDFGTCNIMVDETDCHLVAGVIDWAKASIHPFGLNLDIIQTLISKIHLQKGWIRYDDYKDLEAATFWRVLRDEVAAATAAAGGPKKQGDKSPAYKLIDEEAGKVFKAARVIGLLMSWAADGVSLYQLQSQPLSCG